jgi:hypothetical protein
MSVWRFAVVAACLILSTTTTAPTSMHPADALGGQAGDRFFGTRSIRLSDTQEPNATGRIIALYPVMRQADLAECPRPISPLTIARRRFGGTTASALNSSHASRVKVSSVSSWAMRLRVAASSSASTLRVPSMTPASINACRFHRNRVDCGIPVSAATAATHSPDRRRWAICRRTVAGYVRGT